MIITLFYLANCCDAFQYFDSVPSLYQKSTGGMMTMFITALAALRRKMVYTECNVPRAKGFVFTHLNFSAVLEVCAKSV